MDGEPAEDERAGSGPGAGVADVVPLGPVAGRAGADRGTTDHPGDGFADAYHQHAADLTRVATLLVGSRAEAEELVQEVFTRAWMRWDRIDEPARYLRRAVVNASRSLLRRRVVHRRYEQQLASGVAELGARELLDAVGRLPARQRAAVVLRYYAGLSERETAEAIGCRPGTVGSLVFRALARLRAEVDRP